MVGATLQRETQRPESWSKSKGCPINTVSQTPDPLTFLPAQFTKGYCEFLRSPLEQVYIPKTAHAIQKNREATEEHRPNSLNRSDRPWALEFKSITCNASVRKSNNLV